MPDSKTNERKRAIEWLSEFVKGSVEQARASEAPFYHLEFDRFFPDDIYGRSCSPCRSLRLRPMHGRSKATDGTPTRVKIDLFPEYIRTCRPKSVRSGIWSETRSVPSGKEAFIRRLAPALEKRFGAEFASSGMYPVPILTRDIPGYSIKPHTDTHWKGITVQINLPRDDANTNIGTIFHEQEPDGILPKTTQMRFAPNTGYAFAVGDDTWHSADPVGTDVKTRDTILLTYFVDQALLRTARNRGKRLGNFLLNEMRHRARPVTPPAHASLRARLDVVGRTTAGGPPREPAKPRMLDGGFFRATPGGAANRSAIASYFAEARSRTPRVRVGECRVRPSGRS